MIHTKKEAGEIGETKLSHFDEAESLLEKLMDLKAHFFPAERVIKRDNSCGFVELIRTFSPIC